MKKVILISTALMLICMNCFAQTPEEQVRMILNDNSIFTKGDTKHKLYRHTLSRNKFVIVALTSNSTHTCHACGAFVSAFLFNKPNLLMRDYVKVTEIGSWGSPLTKYNIEIHPITERFMLVVNGSFTNMGGMEDYIRCFYEMDEKLKLVGDDIPTFSDNSGAYEVGEKEYSNWKADYSFIPKENDLPEIRLDMTGVKGTTNFSETKYYYFNGKQYVEKK